VQPSRGFSTVLICGALCVVITTALLSTNFDFRAFYCAGYAVNAHASPYQTEPLHTCERTRTDAAFAAFFKDVALPAPQPGYDVAAFSLFARLPFAAASKIWTALLLVCALGTVVFVRRVVHAPPASVFAALWLSLCVTSLYLGEIVPVCLCAIAAAALCAQTSRFTLAGIAAAASLVEPHIGMPVCLSVALWLPRSRAALGVSVLALAAISLCVLGVRENVAYVASVLPAHALSEIRSDAQLSLAAVLHGLGVPDAAALRIGAISFVLVTLAGLPLARNLARRFDDGAFLVAVPAALAVLGGVFMHVTELVAAVPLALLLAQNERAHRFAAVLGLLLLSVPWWSLATPFLLGTAAGVILSSVTLFYLALAYAQAKPLEASALAIAAAIAASAVLRWHDASAIHGVVASVPPSIALSPYPESGWKWFNDTYMATGSAASWVLRAASWAGLCSILWSACVRVRRLAIAA
jgi:hypothetical protein